MKTTIRFVTRGDRIAGAVIMVVGSLVAYLAGVAATQGQWFWSLVLGVGIGAFGAGQDIRLRGTRKEIDVTEKGN